MHRHMLLLYLPMVSLFIGCDLAEPTDRPYNQAARPPEVAGLQELGIRPGEGLAGEVFVAIDPAIGVPQWATQALLVDGVPVNGAWFSGNVVGFDTRGYSAGVHTLSVGVMNSTSSPPETGLLGYLGVPDNIFYGEVVFNQTSPLGLPVDPAGERPAVDATRNIVYVMGKDSIKAFSTSTNALLRSRLWNDMGYYHPSGQIALSADGTRLYMYSGDFGAMSHLRILDALTFDSLLYVPVNYPISEIVCGTGDRLYVASSTGLFFVPGAPGILRVLDGATLGQISQLALPIEGPMSMVATDDRRTLFLASTGVCRVSAEGESPTLQLQKATGRVESIGVSPDAQQLFLYFNEDPFDQSVGDHLTVWNPSTLDSTGAVELDPSTSNVWDILPSAHNLFTVVSVLWDDDPLRVARHSGLHARTASWALATYDARSPVQVSGDGRYLYAAGGSFCIPLP